MSVGIWTRVCEENRENKEWTVECQGLAFDGHHWLVASNQRRDHKTRYVYRMDANWSIVSKLAIPVEAWHWHLGDLDFHDGHVYAAFEIRDEVPHVMVSPYDPEHGTGWTPQFSPLGGPLPEEGEDTRKDHRPEDMPWCALNPDDELLYASEFGNVTQIHAYDSTRQFERVRTVDVMLDGEAMQEVQGGTFSPSGMLYLSVGRPTCVVEVDLDRGGATKVFDVQVRTRRPYYEEMEGLCWAELAPPLVTRASQLHLVVLDNDLLADDVFMKHFGLQDEA